MAQQYPGNQLVVSGIDINNNPQQCTATLIHTGDAQVVPTGNAMLVAGIAALQNPSGTVDNQRAAGADGIFNTGLTSGVANLKQSNGLTTSSSNVAASNAPVTLAVLSSAIFKVNGTAVIDQGTANVETQVVTAIPNGTSITVAKLVNAHNGSVTAFLLESFVYNEERDAFGEGDVSPMIGCATALAQEYDGINAWRERNMLGAGVSVNTLNGAVTAGNLVVLTMVSALPSSLAVGQGLVMDPLNAVAECVKIVAFNAGAKTVTVRTMLNNHGNASFVLFPTQNLGGAPTNFCGAGFGGDIAITYSGINATNGMVQYTAEKDAQALMLLNSNFNVALSTTSGQIAGIDADMEIGVVGTAALTLANQTTCPDQHGQGGEDLTTVGGRVTGTVAAGAATAAVVIKATAGRLCRIIVTSNATAALSIFDNASAASGTILATIKSTAVAGDIYDVQMPAALGITAGQVSGSPAVTVSFY